MFFIVKTEANIIGHVSSYGGSSATDPIVITIDDRSYLLSGAGSLLNVYFIDGKLKLQLLHSIFLNGYVRDIANRNDTIYCAVDYVGAIRITEISSQDPIVDTVIITSHERNSSIALSENCLFLGMGDSGIICIDLHSNNKILWHTPIPGYMNRLLINKDYLWAAAADAGLQSLCISDIMHPVQGESVMEDSVNFRNIAVVDTFLYIGNIFELCIFNIAEPAKPVCISNNTYHAIRSLSIFDGIICLTLAKTVYFLDAENALNQTPLGYLNVEQGRSTCLKNGIACTISDGEIYLIDCSNISSPEIVDTLLIDGFVTNVATDKNKTYIASNGNRISVLDCADPKNPIKLGSMPLDSNTRVSFTIDEDRVYIAGNVTGFSLLDVSNTDSIAELYSFPSIDPNGLLTINESKSIAYFFNSHYINIYKLESTEPIMLGFIQNVHNSPRSMANHDGYLFLGSLTAPYLQIYDVRLPSETQFLSERTVNKPITDIAFHGGNAYMIVDSSLCIYDISVIDTPRAISTCAIPCRAFDLEIKGAFAWVATRSGVYMIDISDKYAPCIIDHYRTTGEAKEISLTEELVFAANYNGGLDILTFSPSAIKETIPLKQTIKRKTGFKGNIKLTNLSIDATGFDLNGRKIYRKSGKYSAKTASMYLLFPD